jgi:hypothetical protein
MGVNAVTKVDPPEAGEADLATASGSLWDRVAFHWHEIQPQPLPAPWNWSPADARYGNEPLASILGVLTSQPNTDPWHQHPQGFRLAPVDIDAECAKAYISTTLGLPGGRLDGNCVVFTGLDQSAYRDGQISPDNQWAYFVYQTTSRYADRVSAWQIYNEDEFIIPTDYNYLDPTQPLAAPISYYPDPVHFLDAVETAYQVIKVGGNGVLPTDPDAAIILASPEQFYMWVILVRRGDISESELPLWVRSMPTWAQEWYRNLYILPHNAYSHLDGTGLHLYSYPYRGYQYVWALKDEFELSASPIWFTESGVDVPEFQSTTTCAGGNAVNCFEVDPTASYILQQFAWTHKAFHDAGVPSGKVFHFAFRDADGLPGLIDENMDLPRPGYFAFQFINNQLLALSYADIEETPDYVRMIFMRGDNERVSIMWAKTQRDAFPQIEAASDRAMLFDQRGLQINLQGVPSSEYIHPGANGHYSIYLRGVTHLRPDILGGRTLILIEPLEEGTLPTLDLALVVKNCKAIATDYVAYDPNHRLREVRGACSPEQSLDLSWLTEPGVVYAGRVNMVPPVNGSCVITLTNEIGQSITRTLSNPQRKCDDDNDSPPGCDHPDDNASSASAQEREIALPPGARETPAVALLANGYAFEAEAFLAQAGEPVEWVGEDFDPIATAAQYPVLVIPSGGLYGLEESASFRARLEEYARQGGTILAFAQQHGYEYQALPGASSPPSQGGAGGGSEGGRLGAYGWSEDVSCFDASLVMETWHPILSGFDRATLSAHVDGYFTSVPSGTQVLLSRTANGQPAAILYVYVATIYTDGAPVWSLVICHWSFTPGLLAGGGDVV